MKKKYSIINRYIRLITLLILVINPFSIFSQDAPLKVRVAVFPFYPAIFMNSEGKADGFYADMLKEIAKHENWELEFVPGTWAEGLERAKRHEIDLVTSVAYKEERTQFLDYGSQPSFTVWSILYANQNVSINNIFDVNGKKIGIMKNDVNGQNFIDMCTKFGIQCQYVYKGTFVDIFNSIQNGELDAGVTANSFGYSSENKYKVTRTSIIINPFHIYFASPKGNHSYILNTTDRYLKEWKKNKDGEYNKIINKWLFPLTVNNEIPRWLIITVISIVLLLAFSFLAIYIFRKQVQKATDEIRSINKSLEHEIEERKKSSSSLRAVLEGTSSSTGEQFFKDLILNLAEVLNCSVATIGEYDKERYRINTIAIYQSPDFINNFSYSLKNTPCEQVFQEGLCVFNDNVRELFPEDEDLVNLEVNSYMGIPLYSLSGEPLGILAVLSNGKIDQSDLAKNLMQIFSMRAAAEIERINNENALKKSEALLTNVFNSIPDLLTVHDANLRILMSNWHGYEHLSPAERANNPFCFKAYMNHDAPCPDCHIIKVFKTGVPIKDLEEKTDQGRFREINVFPVFDSYNKVIMVAQHIRDITERKNSELALSRSEEKFKSYVDFAPDGIFILDKNLNIIETNSSAEKLSGYSIEKLKVLNIKDIFNDYTNYFDNDKLNELLNKGHIHSEFKIQKADLSFSHILFDAVTLNDDTILVYTKDISERKSAEEALQTAKHQLEEANKLKSIILGNLGHELRTPLNGIIGFAQLISNSKDLNEHTDLSEYIHDSAIRLRNTLNSLLALSEIESNNLKIKPVPIRIDEFVKNASENFKKMVISKNLNLEIECNSDDLIIESDSYLLNQVMFNLVDNAVKFTNEGFIKLETNRYFENGLTFGLIKISDSGIGINPNSLNQIFEPFRQASEGVARTHSGVGIGLTITQKILHLLNAEIFVESKIEQGSTFIIKLPSLD